jgi:hypothetical protein
MDYGSHGAGKGDGYRAVNLAQYQKNYEAIFGKKKVKAKPKKPKK